MDSRRLLSVVLYGSQLYGTATEASDIDLKAVFMPALDELLLAQGKSVPPSVNDVLHERRTEWAGRDVETEYIRLHEFVRLAADAQTMALDMLWAPEPCRLRTSPIWARLVERRRMFLSKNMQAFMGYARSQASIYSAKGERLDILERVLLELAAWPRDAKLSDAWISLVQSNLAHSPHVRFIPATPRSNNQRLFEVCSRQLMEGVSIGYAQEVLTGIVRDYGKRARKAQQAKGADWKALSHAIRVIEEVEDIVKYREIRFPRPNAPHLLRIKRGEIPAAAVLDELDGKFAEVQKLVDASDLPESVDAELHARWLVGVVHDFYGIPAQG